jgi:hypothetical protein
MIKKIKQNKNYFTSETETAIIEYNQTEDYNIKNRIYEQRIHYPFFKLTQNLIHTFKFYNTDVDDLEHLQHEIIVFLISKLPLFHHSNNINDRIRKIITKEFNEEYNDDFRIFTNYSPQITQEQISNFVELLDVSDDCKNRLCTLTPPKAYSYFGTIAKRWLILYSNGNYDKKIQNLSTDILIEDKYALNHSYKIDDNVDKNDKLNYFIDEYIKFCNINLLDMFPKKNDSQIADAILELFRKREDINIFNKKALYIYIKEIVDVKTPKITKISDKLYEIFKKNYVFFLEEGYINFKI